MLFVHVYLCYSRMATVRAGSFFDAVRFSGPVRFAAPVWFVRFTRFGQWPKSSRDANTEIVTKIVAMRAVKLSTGPFRTEFGCEYVCDLRFAKKNKDV